MTIEVNPGGKVTNVCCFAGTHYRLIGCPPKSAVWPMSQTLYQVSFQTNCTSVRMRLGITFIRE